MSGKVIPLNDGGQDESVNLEEGWTDHNSNTKRSVYAVTEGDCHAKSEKHELHGIRRMSSGFFTVYRMVSYIRGKTVVSSGVRTYFALCKSHDGEYHRRYSLMGD